MEFTKRDHLEVEGQAVTPSSDILMGILGSRHGSAPWSVPRPPERSMRGCHPLMLYIYALGAGAGEGPVALASLQRQPGVLLIITHPLFSANTLPLPGGPGRLEPSGWCYPCFKTASLKSPSQISPSSIFRHSWSDS